jgi:tetratricopeptide (TPR) repeat protein
MTTTTIDLDHVLRAAKELAKAGRWGTATSLLDATATDDDKDKAKIALASVEVALEGDWFGGTDNGRARLHEAETQSKRAKTDDAQGRWDLDFLRLRIDYRSMLFGPEGKDPDAMADLRRRGDELWRSAPDSRREGWASMYLGLIADNVYGERHLAPAHYQRALEHSNDDPFLAREALRHLGDHDHEDRDYEAAYEKWARATELGAAAGTVSGTLSQQLVLAILARDTGDVAGARLLAREIARWADAIGAKSLAAQARSLQEDDHPEG